MNQAVHAECTASWDWGSPCFSHLGSDHKLYSQSATKRPQLGIHENRQCDGSLLTDRLYHHGILWFAAFYVLWSSKRSAKYLEIFWHFVWFTGSHFHGHHWCIATRPLIDFFCTLLLRSTKSTELVDWFCVRRGAAYWDCISHSAISTKQMVVWLDSTCTRWT